jgi:hypothetical protein
VARYEPPDRGDDPTARFNPQHGKQADPAPTPWYRNRVVLLSLVLAILVALIIWGIFALFTGNQGGAPSMTTTTQTATTTATTSVPTTTTTTSGGFHLPSLPSTITLPSLPSVITLPSLP